VTIFKKGGGMQIKRNIKVPTGNIYIAQEEKGLLEFLSIADYGKERNVKADFMGLHKDIDGVNNGDPLPLEEKWVITTSTQYGCSMGCKFCDVPKVGPGINATKLDLIDQVMLAVMEHPEVKYTKRLNHHFARMGEPSFNAAVIDSAILLKAYFVAKGWHYHPVVSTMCPAQNTHLQNFIDEWIELKNSFDGEAGLQLSINSTDKEQRKFLFSNKALDLGLIARMFSHYGANNIRGRKIALNFAITDQTIIDAARLAELFDPNIFMCKLTPIHITKEAISNKLLTTDGYTSFYPYAQHEGNLKKAGFDVLVFVPSQEEDESRITCGNAILADLKEKK
jgi:23S rRNA (adenine2503-C2)-methyltransferase